MLILALALLAAPAFASDWSAALPAKSVEAQIVGKGVKVLVAAAGEDSADRDAAASALVAGLRASKTVKLALSDDALGDLSKLDDAAIVAKAKGQPVDQIWVARVFPASGSDATAVVTMYRPDGSVIGAFTGGTNEPLTAGAPVAAGAGLSTAAAAALETAGSEVTRDRAAVVKVYEERAIMSRGYATVNAQTGQVMSTGTILYKGKYGGPLNGAKLYEYLGRDDLAKQYRARATANTVAVLGGLGAVVGGTLWLVNGAFFFADDPDSECYEYIEYDDDYNEIYPAAYDTCADRVKDRNQEGRAAQKTSTIGGVTLLSAGTVAMMVPIFHRSHPAKWEEIRRMVDTYNEDLRKELGLGEGAGAGPMGYDWSMAGYAWHRDGMTGATLRVEF